MALLFIAYERLVTGIYNAARRAALREPLVRSAGDDAARIGAAWIARAITGEVTIELRRGTTTRSSTPQGQACRPVCRKARRRDPPSSLLPPLDPHHPQSHPRPLRARALPPRPSLPAPLMSPSANPFRRCLLAKTFAPLRHLHSNVRFVSTRLRNALARTHRGDRAGTAALVQEAVHPRAINRFPTQKAGLSGRTPTQRHACQEISLAPGTLPG